MFCLEKQELIAQVESCLERIAKLARAGVDVLRDELEEDWLEIDRQIEAAFGEKERSVGALRQHRKEHGC